MPVAVAYGRWSLIREVVALGGSTMSSVDYFTTVLSKLAYAKDKLNSCVAHSVYLLGATLSVFKRAVKREIYNSS